MKIAMVILRFKPAIGGGEEHVYQIAKRLLARGHEILIYTSDLLQTSPRYVYFLDEMEKINGIPVRRFHAIRLLRDYPVLPAIGISLVREEADIIHAHGYGYFPCDMSALICRVRHIPFIVTSHGFFPASTPVNRLLEAVYIKFSQLNLLKAARKVICCSTADAKHYSRLMHPNKILVVPNGIDVKDWRRLPGEGSFRARYNLDGPVITSVGRIVYAKGFQYLIRAAPAILERFPNATIVIAGGDFGYLTKLHRLAHKLRVSQSIVFTGLLSDEELKELYVDSDIVVIPNVYDGQLVALEAMACGKPIVASRIGGLPDIIKHGVNGVLVEPANFHKLAEAISTLLEDQALARGMGGFNEVEVEGYSWDRVVEVVEKVYYQII